MTINTTHTFDTHLGNSATVTFAINFQFYSSNDIVVTFDDGISPPVNQLPGSYSISGGNGSTGSITFLVAPPAGIEIVVERVMSLVQQASYTRNDPFPSATHEIALDRLVMMIQQTLAGSSSASSVTPEFIQDIVGALFTDVASVGITFTYDDIAGTITALVTAVGITDAASDGKYYVRRNAGWIEESWTNIAGKPSTFAPSAHTHPSVDITDLTAVTQDTVAPMFNHALHTNLSFVYDNVTKKISGIAVGSGGSTAAYDWVEGLTLVDPGAGNIAANNANLNAATHILVSSSDTDGLSTNLSTALVNDTIVLNDETNVAFGVYNIDAISYGAGFIDFTVTVNASLSTGNPTAADVINASLVITNVSAGISDAPADGVNYGRKNTAWTLIDWTDLVNIPSSFVPSAHTHPASAITDFAEAADDRIAALLVAGSGIAIAYNDIANTLTISASGVVLSISTSDTAPGSPVDGQLWWNSTNGVMYVYYDDGTSSQWVVANPGSAGPPGADGVDGTDGVDGADSTVPGPDGVDGSTWHNGAGAPAGGLGIVGDYYLNVGNSDVYEKTGASTWTLVANLEGAPGAGSGDVVGPAGVTDDLPAIFDGITGKLIKSKTYAAFKTLLSLVKGDVGLGSVDNTADTAKPVSTAQQTALDLKVTGPAGAVTDDVPAVFDGTTGELIKQKTYAAFKTLLALVKGDVGLGNVDNTADTAKPVSTAQQTALDLKANLTDIFGQQTIYMPAGAMIARTTNGPASVTTETATNKVMRKSLDFDTSTQEFAQFSIQMPKGWDEGTLIAQFVWSHAATTTNFGVAWALQAVALADSDTLEVAFGTEQVAVDTGGTTDDIYISPETAAITVAGSPAAEEYVIFQVKRVPADGSDNMAIDAKLLGVKIHYTINAAKDD